MIEFQKKIEKIFKKKNLNKNYQISEKNTKIINKIIQYLNSGKIRVAEKIQKSWQTNQWIKKAVLLYLSNKKNHLIKTMHDTYYDKIPLKYTYYDKIQFSQDSVRIVPNATIRFGAFIEKNVIIMPSFINIGAYIGKNSMIDTWATVGSCAQIGKNVHLSGGVGIGGVLEPVQNNPTIIEDNCFIGARSEIVEGVIVGKGSVISMGVYIGQSTKIYDRSTDKISYGKIPKYSVVVPGTIASKNKNIQLYCAVIVKKVDNKTLKKTELNSLLRDKQILYNIS
ncbi:2,3,4,5-tetrahydropyridine-2,6-dicarboxylate N-succinyltransferase [Buchnera aphidicola]|uniref:2,3,4,5-tetrahydropyridine-2,6-dicarboxylate N-succinyltransferase n=1 Tax=Buchnera aphidicola subsp. Tuberolachnus salignus TaxID=98804 RepID=A0A160SWS1_BUCTT|nr:2,3,4,5-tetrahydropyridine-2,6-dicarboxylate N-succinyltransferase [Buchnera aphidicola]CUR53130.1 2,3,4,5-tetrahydropyridine-2,6-dicarboxylate N-succinyltransferase [Buchnera aphidicola (Tuberolachnus salignus)]